MALPTDTSPRAPRVVGLFAVAGALLGFLLLQNLAGTYVNLWVNVPESGGASNIAWLFEHSAALSFHVVNGFLLLALAILLVLRARQLGDQRVTRPAWAALVSIILAGWGGGAFTFYKQDDAFSFVMELGFVLAIGATSGVLLQAARTFGTPKARHEGSTPPTNAETSG